MPVYQLSIVVLNMCTMAVSSISYVLKLTAPNIPLVNPRNLRVLLGPVILQSKFYWKMDRARHVSILEETQN